MLGCETLFGVTRGAQARALIEKATGAPCPCALGTCPLVPVSQSVQAPQQEERPVQPVG